MSNADVVYMPRGHVKGAEEVLIALKKKPISAERLVKLSFGYPTKALWYLRKYGAEIKGVRNGRKIETYELKKAPGRLPDLRERGIERGYVPVRNRNKRGAVKAA